MPIRFHCPHCHQKLTVSSRKAGARADCPRCHTSLTIPAAEAAAVAAGSPVEPPHSTTAAAQGAADTAFEPTERTSASVPIDGPPPAVGVQTSVQGDDDDAEEPFPTFSWADEHELVYDSDNSGESALPVADQQDLVALPRVVLYLQGGLLAVVAVASFSIGFLAGGSFGSPPAAPPEPLACTISGTVNYSAGGRNLPDEGAVVAIIPQNSLRPDEKAPVAGLRTSDPTPDASHPGIAILRQVGGGYARADHEGHFEIELPDRGQYLVLVISRGREAGSIDEISTSDILKLGPYFDNVAELLGQQRYELTSQAVRGDRQINVVF